MSPRRIFEEELKELKDKVSEMGACAEISYQKLFFAVKEKDGVSMKQLLDTDRKMTDRQRSIEAGCLALMTKQQPIARDLRFVSSALKVVTDMERIGDHVADMAELFLRQNSGTDDSDGGTLILSMMEAAGAMLKESVRTFVEGDAEGAEKVITSDDIVDALFNRVKESMMEAIRTQSLDADIVVDNLMIAKYLEKIGDHAVNIAEWAVFQVTGEIEGAEIY